jgi:serine/threonine-protein kinase
MLTGQVPFTASSARESMQRRVDEPPPDVRALRPDVPDEVAAVLKRAMMIDPAERYMSADQMSEALGSTLQLLSVS